MSLTRYFSSTHSFSYIPSFQDNHATAKYARDIALLRHDSMNGLDEGLGSSRSGELIENLSGSPEARPLNKTGTRGTVIVTDDEPAIRAMMAMVLSTARYQVIQAENGMDAAYYIHQFGGRIDALITDVMMPLVSGPELAAWVRHAWSHIPILFVSAFYEPSRLQLSSYDVAHHFLAKPFSLSALTTKVRLLIDQTRNDAGKVPHASC